MNVMHVTKSLVVYEGLEMYIGMMLHLMLPAAQYDPM